MRAMLPTLVLVAVASSIGTAAHATVMVRRSIDELAAASDAIVVAEARSQSSQWDHGRIYTDVRVTVASGVRGARAGDTLIVRTPGGRVDTIGQGLAGAPAFVAGQRYVLFLRHGRSGAFETVGLSQGVLPVRGTDAQSTVLPATTAGLELVNGVSPHATIDLPAGGMPLAALVHALETLR